MKGLTSCPARWAFESANRKPDEPFAATTLGTEMHTIYETFYDEEKVAIEDREPDLLTQMIEARAEELWGDQTLPENPTAPQKKALAANKKKWIKETTSRVMGILKIEDPKKVIVMRAHQKPDGTIVYEPESDTKPVSGIELGADQVEIAGIPFIGYIDRIRVDGYDTENRPFLVPEDYKSSKRVPWLRSGDTDDDGDQVTLYAEIIRIITGDLPEEARLLYTKVGKDRVVKITDRSLARAISRFVKANSVMDSSCSSGEFSATKTSFCGWCPLVDSCPTAIKNGTDRAATNTNPVVLGIPTVRPLGGSTPTSMKGDDLPVISADEVTVVTRTAEDMKDGKGSLQVRPEEREAAEAALAQQKPAVPTMMVKEKSAEAVNEGEAEMTNNGFLSHKDKVPYDEFMPNSDELNPNSYAAVAVFDVTEIALTRLVKEFGTGISVGQIRSLSAVFAQIVNRAFFEITGKRDGDNGVSIWQTGVSTRIRFALRTVLNTYDDIPILGGSDEHWEDWIEKTVRRITAIARIAVGIWETDQTEVEGDKPWEALVEKSDEATKAPAEKKTTRKTSTGKKE